MIILTYLLSLRKVVSIGRRLGNINQASVIAFSSILFGLFHLNVFEYDGLLAIAMVVISYSVSGLILSVMRLKLGFMVSLSVHILTNSTPLLAVWYFYLATGEYYFEYAY